MNKKTEEANRGNKKIKENNDNVIYVGGSKEAEENNKIVRKRALRQKNAAVLVVILLVVAAFVFVYSMLNKEYKGYKVINSSKTTYENTASYIQFNSNLLKYTPDGVSYINSNGDTVWSAGISMKMPVADACGKYAVIADLNGNSVCVFDTKGQLASLTMPYTICDIDVASQGAFAVVLESDRTNYINLYDKNGDIIYEIQTTIDKSGYPVDITISDDGQKLFTSYLYVDGTSMKNNLTAYNFGDVGQNSNADRMVGGYMFEEQLFPKLEFIDNDTVVAYGTHDIYVYSMKEKPSEKARISLDSDIQSVFYGKDYIGIIQKCNDESEHLYILTAYDEHGKKQFDQYIDFDYSYLYSDDKEIIVTGECDCLIIRKNGRVKYSGRLEKNIVSMVPNDKKLEYVVVYQNQTDIIKLQSEPATEDNTVEENTTKE